MFSKDFTFQMNTLSDESTTITYRYNDILSLLISIRIFFVFRFFLNQTIYKSSRGYRLWYY